MKGPFATLLLLFTIFTGGFTDTPVCTPSTLASNHPHETDCSRYYHCEDGILTTFTCSEGHLFDLNLGTCDLATICPNLEVKYADEDCPETPTCAGIEWGQKKPFPPDCSKYIYCDVIGNSNLEDCPSGEHFGPVILKCASPDIAKCLTCGDLEPTETPTTEAPTDCATEPFCAPEDLGVSYPYPNNCTLYIYCPGDLTEEIRRCPNEEHFSPEFRACRDPETANCVPCTPVWY